MSTHLPVYSAVLKVRTQLTGYRTYMVNFENVKIKVLPLMNTLQQTKTINLKDFRNLLIDNETFNCGNCYTHYTPAAT